jgi:hypothetical protein
MPGWRHERSNAHQHDSADPCAGRNGDRLHATLSVYCAVLAFIATMFIIALAAVLDSAAML